MEEARLAQHIRFKTLDDRGSENSRSIKKLDLTKNVPACKPMFKIEDTSVDMKSPSPNYTSPMPSLFGKSFLFPPKNDSRNRLTSTPNPEQNLGSGIQLQDDTAFDFSPLTCDRTINMRHKHDEECMDDIKSVLFPTSHPKMQNLDNSIDIIMRESDQSRYPTESHFVNASDHGNTETSIGVTKPVFPNFFGSPVKHFAQDSGFDSVTNSISMTTVSDSLNMESDLVSQISPLKRRARDDCSTISVESPMKRLAFMSLDSFTNNDSGISVPTKSTIEPSSDEPGSTFLTSPCAANSTNVPALSSLNGVNSGYPKKQLFNESCTNVVRNELDDFKFTKPSSVLRRPIKKSLEMKPRKYTRKLSISYVNPITESKQGQKYFDIIDELANRGMQHIIENIFSHIRKKDILRCSYVSQSWCEISRNNSYLHKQIKSLKNQYKQDEFTRGPENITAKKAEENALLKSPAKIGSKRNLTAGRYALCNLQERVRKSPKKPVLMPTTPSGKNRFVSADTKFEHSQRVKRTLEFEESFMTCPKCSWTAKIYAGGQNKAQCYRVECGYRFCIGCKKEYHWPEPCKIRSPVSPTLEPTTKSIKAGSKKSKARLKKRLLM